MNDFVHLHVHSEFSLLDSSCKIRDLVERAKELNMKAIAITDHGVMYGCIEFYKICKQYDIKPIIGCEVYIANKSMYIKNPDKENFTSHLVLLVKNEEGYKNLLKIVSKGFTDGFYYKPRVDLEFLEKHSEGLIALSACLSGGISKFILKDDFNGAKILASRYKEIFCDDFYLELQSHGISSQEKVNKYLVELSRELDIQLVATNDVHYIKKEDHLAHDILICIQTASNVDEQNRMRYEGQEFYLKSKDEMKELFKDYEDAFLNTTKISEKCNFEYRFGNIKPPNYIMNFDISQSEYLKRLCFFGLIKKYEVFCDIYSKYKDIDLLNDQSFNALLEEIYGLEDEFCKNITERLSNEFDLIYNMGYVDYFLIVWDFIKFANENNIPTGPGRGSVAGSIIAYVLNITKIDPIKYGLIFERFLNPERISMPDIDSDFCYERRQEVIDYVTTKYGSCNVSQIITFGTMAARAVIRDVGRAMNYTYSEVDRIAKMIPSMLNITIELALLYNKELNELYKNDKRVKDLIDISKKLEGLPRHTSIHAAGVIISPVELFEVVPVQRGDNEGIVTQFPMGNLEELGLLKMDFLGLRTLTVISNTVKIIEENKGINIDIDKLPIDDKNVFNMIGEGKTCGVFQLESTGMTKFMKELKPESLEDIIAGISLYRPGPMEEIPTYIQNKNNPKDVKYLTSKLKDILDVTYGVIVYQEQVMEIVQKLSGYSLGRSDLVRRAMAKKKHDVMELERKNFVYGIEEDNKVIVRGCIRNGIDENIANKIFDQMLHFAAYAFNKSHAAAYALVAYQTAYLIKYYKSEYICALLNSVINNTDKVCEYIRFSDSLNIKIYPPSINNSVTKFRCDGEDIYFGLSAIKNVGINVCDKIVEYRKKFGLFKNEQDFFIMCVKNGINKKSIESLIKAGALDSFKISRTTLLYNFDSIVDGINADFKKNIEGQISLFDDFDSKNIGQLSISYRQVLEDNDNRNFYFEKEVLGLYLSGHPIDKYKFFIDNVCTYRLENFFKDSEENELINFKNFNFSDNIRYDKEVVVGGLIRDFRKILTKTNKLMSFICIEDRYFSLECVVFPKIYEQFNYLISKDNIIIVKGKLTTEDDEAKILVEDILSIDDVNRFKLYILVNNIGDINNEFEKLKPVFKSHKGDFSVVLYSLKEKKGFRLSDEYMVDLSNEFICKLESLISEDRIKITFK